MNKRRCGSCRYWSDLLAYKAEGSGTMEAVCLSDKSDSRGEYVRKPHFCKHYAVNDLGAVDEPGSDPLRYRRREGAEA
jgi:hypothetical protein